MNIVFFFATLQEAEITIRMVDAIEKDERKTHFLFEGGEIIISGMGMVAARAAASTAPSKECRWVNLGVAGSLEKTLPIGTAVPIGRTVALQWHSERGVYHHIPEEMLIVDRSLPAVLFTSPVPLYSAPDVSEKISLVDMEGYALACVAREKNISFSMVKVVSDFCTDTSHATISKNIDALSYRLAEEAIQ
jgi:nucleoside phosphorylase